MGLERALEVAIQWLPSLDHVDGDAAEAAAALRAFKEKGLPFYRAAEKRVTDYLKHRPDGIPFGDDLRALVDAYRAMKGGKSCRS